MRIWMLAGLLWTGTARAGVPEAMTTSYAAEAGGDYASALAALEGVGVAGETAYVVTLRRAWLLYLQGRHADAASAYQAASALRADSTEARLGATLPLIALRRWTEAAAACEAVLATDPANYLALSRLAWVRFNQGRYADAAARYESVVIRYPSDVEMRAGLAWSWLKLGRTSEARALFQWVLQVAPTQASAKQGLEAAGG